MDTPEGSCEYSRQGLNHLPAMLFINASGGLVESTTDTLDKDTLQQKLENLFGFQ